MLTATWDLVVSYDIKTGEKLWSADVPGLEQVVPSMVHADNILYLGSGTHGVTKQCIALRLSGTGKDTKTEVAWKSTKPAHAPECVSPVLYDNRLYSVNGKGIMTCFDCSKKGKARWSERLTGNYFSSLIAADGKVYACADDGKVAVIAAGDRFEFLAENDLGEPILSSPAIADGCLLIRTKTTLYCIGKK